MPENHREIIEKIGDELEAAIAAAAPKGGLYGAHAGTVVRRVVPEFTPHAFGAQKLRDFIASNFPNIVEVGTAGLDVVYGLSSWKRDQPQGAAALETPNDGSWRAWVSPGSPVALFVERRSGLIRLRSVRAEPASTELCIRPLPIAAHREIATSFLETRQVEGVCRSALEAALQANDREWWVLWQRAMRRPCATLASSWSDYRREQLEHRFTELLRDEGLTDSAVQEALRRIEHAREAYQKTPKPTRGRTETRAPSAKDDDLRGVAHAAVDLLSDHELRAVWFPLGVIIEAQKSAR